MESAAKTNSMSESRSMLGTAHSDSRFKMSQTRSQYDGEPKRKGLNSPPVEFSTAYNTTMPNTAPDFYHPHETLDSAKLSGALHQIESTLPVEMLNRPQTAATNSMLTWKENLPLGTRNLNSKGKLLFGHASKETIQRALN